MRRTKSNEWKTKPVPQEPPKTPAPPPVLQEKLVREQPKPKEPRNQADLVRRALVQQERQRSSSEPVQELVRKINSVSLSLLEQLCNQRLPLLFSYQFFGSSLSLLSLCRQNASLLCSLFSFQPRIPPPDYKLPPEKLGYLRHVTPAPKQVIPDNFHVESVHLRHAYPPNSSQSEKPRYAHLLRKTGKRGELGIKDDDDSEVTRICFNVPLVGVT